VAEQLLEEVAALDAPWLLLLAFLLPFGETVALLDVIVPGELGLIVVGAAARVAGVPLVAVIGVASVGAFLGDSTSWFIGHRWGTALLRRWAPVWQRMEAPLARAEDHFARYGGPTVFGARFVGPLRALVPLVAGTSGMTYRRFVPWNALASIAWVSLVVVLGAVFGETVASTIDRFGLVVAGLLVAAALGLWIRHRRRSAPRDGRSEGLN
jgi:membrane-associated protein